MSDNPEFDRQLEENRRAYEALREEIRTRYAGQYVGIAFGRIIAVDPDFARVCEAIDRLDPQPEHQAVFPADDEPRMDDYYENLSVEFN